MQDQLRSLVAELAKQLELKVTDARPKSAGPATDAGSNGSEA
jgi:hypothetical protein